MMVRHERKPADVSRFSRRWCIAGLHTLFWVVLVTVLIWIYADMEFTDTAKIIATIKLDTGESGQLELLSRTELPVEFEISGSRSSLEDFQRELDETGALLSYDVSRQYKRAGKHLLPLAEVLDYSAGLAKRGISLKNPRPGAVEVQLDTIIEVHDVPVELKTTGATAQPATRPKVSLFVPTSRWQLIQARLGGNPPKLQTRPVDLSHLQPGVSSKVTAEILPAIEGVAVRPTPASVTFDVQILRSATTKTLPVSVQVLGPASWAETDDTTWQEYVLVRQAPADWRPRLRIEGAKKDLKPENVIAYIQLTDEDKKPISWVEREVTVCFPPGLGLKLLSPRPKLKFRMEKRKPAATN